MVQPITSDLLARLTTMRPNMGPVQAEIEIDERFAAEGTPLLDAGSGGSAGSSSSFALPEVDVSGDEVLLVSFVQIRPKYAISMPAGWAERMSQETTTFGLGEKRWQVSERYVALAAGPYADLYTTPAPTDWGVLQVGFRSAESPQPANQAQGFFDWGWTTPTDVPTLDVAVAAGSMGHYLLAWITPSGGQGNTWNTDDSDLGYILPDGWSELVRIPHGTNISEGLVAYKQIDGTGEESGTLTFGSTRHTARALTVFVLEVAVTAEAVEPVAVTRVYQVASLGVDRSRKMAAAQLDAGLSNEEAGKSFYTQASQIFYPNNPIRAYAWYGDRANRVRRFTGLIDRPAEHREPNSVSVKARSRMKWLLEQGFRASASQDVNDPEAVRTEANGVYLGKTIAYIVEDIFTRAGWPSTDWVIDASAAAITLAEYDLTDGSWAEQIAGADRLTTIAGCDLWEDELGRINFAPNELAAASEPDADWTFTDGVDVLAYDHQADDEQRATRVVVSGPMTSDVPIWKQEWQTSAITHPTGIWYDGSTPTYIRVVDGVTRRIYRLRLSDRKILGSTYIGGKLSYAPLGMAGDPVSGNVWILDADWRFGDSQRAKLREFDPADWSLVNTFTLPNGQWSDIKSDGTSLWLTRYDTGKLYQRDPADGSAIDSWSYSGKSQATGMYIDVANGLIGLFFNSVSNGARKAFYLVDTADPGTITGSQSTKGTHIAGGELNTTSGNVLYASAGAGDFGNSAGYVWAFLLTEQVTSDVTASAIDYDLEDALGLQSGIASRAHEDCPNSEDPHPFEIREAVYAMRAVQSQAQAQDTSDAQLVLLSRLRRQLDLVTIGNPAVQINDVIRYIGPVAGIDSKWILDTYRESFTGSGPYTTAMSVLPWEAPA